MAGGPEREGHGKGKCRCTIPKGSLRVDYEFDPGGGQMWNYKVSARVTSGSVGFERSCVGSAPLHVPPAHLTRTTCAVLPAARVPRLALPEQLHDQDL